MNEKPLLERLRTWKGNPLCIEAADEIERLTKLLRAIENHPDTPKLIAGVIGNELVRCK